MAAWIQNGRMQMRINGEEHAATLIKTRVSVNAEGVNVETDGEATEVFVFMQSIGYREYYAAATADMTVDAKCTMRTADYDGQNVALIEGRRYRIIKTYRMGDMIELTLAEQRERRA